MNNKRLSSIKKEIFLPPIIGDWTTYTSEKNKESISITKSIGGSNKTVSEETIKKLLFFHQEFFEEFFDKITKEINTHIEIDSISINIINHLLFKQSLKNDIYQCKFNLNELEQIDLILSEKATKYIAHRLCGGNSKPDISEPTNIEISLVSVINDIFLITLSEKWASIFEFTKNAHKTHFGLYKYQPQQSESETIIELTANFKLFHQHDLSCKILYSLETIEKLLFYEDLLNSHIKERTHLTKETLKNTKIDVKSIIGETTLALSELQSLEIGDVILLENHKLTDPIKLLIDDTLVFNATPVAINNKEIGVQIVDTPHYEAYQNEFKKPLKGPLITSEATNGHLAKSTQPSHDEPSSVENPPSNFPSDGPPVPELSEEELDFPGDIEDVNTPNILPEETMSDMSSDDLSWDNLDDE